MERAIVENFAELLNFIANPAIILDEKGVVLVANDAAKAIGGTGTRPIVGTSFFEAQFLTYESCAILNSCLERSFENSFTDPFEIKIKTGNNQLRCFEIRGKKITLPECYHLLIFHDVTERKRKEKTLYSLLTENGQEYIQVKELLADSEQKYKQLFEQSIDAIYVIDYETRTIIDCNLAALDLLKLKRTELIGKHETIVNAPAYGEEGFSRVFEALDSGDTFEWQIITKQGQIRDVSIKAALMDVSGRKVIYGTLRDITDRKIIDSRLKDAEKLYRFLFEKAPVGISLVDPTSARFIEFNDTVNQQLGYPKEQFASLTIGDIEAIESRSETKARIAEILREGKTAFNTKHKTKNGEIREMAVTVHAIEIDQKKLLLTTFQDITEQQKLKLELQNYSQNLEKLVEERSAQLSLVQAQLIKSERLAAIGELAGMVGHDIRNPLTAIKNAAYYLNKKGERIDAAKKAEMLQVIDQSVGHANKIINDLLDYSKEIRLEIEIYTPKKLIKDALEILQIPDRITVIADTPVECAICVDINKIQRTFVNILKNAIDAMPKEGTLRITSKTEHNNVVFTFQDTGCGITEQVMQRIFQPLFTTKAQGMGFGLAICRRMIESHKGTINIKSSVGVGTTVIVKLPIKAQDEAISENELLIIPREPAISIKTAERAGR